MGRTAGKQRPTYSCRAHYLPRGDPHRHDGCLNFPCDTIDDVVKAHLNHVLCQPDVLAEAAHERLDPTGRKNDDPQDLLERLATVDTDLAAEVRLFRTQGYTGAALAAVLAPLHEQRQDLLRRIAQAHRGASSSSETTTTAAHQLTTALRSGLQNASPQTWRNLFTALSVEIRVEGYEPCHACTGTGYLPFPKGTPRGWPIKCTLCLRGTLPVLTIELDDITAASIAQDMGSGRGRSET